MITLSEAESAFASAGFRLTHETAKVREYTGPSERVLYWDFGADSRIDSRPPSYSQLRLAIAPSLEAALDTVVQAGVVKGDEKAHSNFTRFPKRQRGGANPIPVGRAVTVSSLVGLNALLSGLGRATSISAQVDEMRQGPTKMTEHATRHPLNSILFGPPGTGKTYTAVARAVSICDPEFAEQYESNRERIVERFRELLAEQRIQAVTFHQSYSYEDFIEGIRPVTSGEGASDLRYECRPGILRRICSLAAQSGRSQPAGVDIAAGQRNFWKMSLGNTDDPDESWIYDTCIENGCVLLGWGDDIDFTGATNRQAVRAALGESAGAYALTAVDQFRNQMKIGDLVVISDGNHYFRAIGEVIGDYEFVANEKFSQKRKVRWLTVLEESLPRSSLYSKAFSQATIYRLTWAHVQLQFLRELVGGSDGVGPKNFVLLIDEINRGNISKIFGELITLIEDDKRAGQINGFPVRLPYSGQEFSVPANLYLLGTMNTADRSIALLDVALRRRFRFEEMMPRPDLVPESIDGIPARRLFETLNRRIEALVDRDHQLGHSFFMKAGSAVELREAFRHEVVPLLQEYFYGDWPRIASVLGTTVDRAVAAEGPSLLRIERLNDGLSGAAPNPYRYSLSPEFCEASGEQLVAFFTAVLNDA